MNCCQGFLSFLRFLFWRERPSPDNEHEELLGREVNSASEYGSEQLQVMVVMRHGERIDEVDESWVVNTDRPWDPPLTQLGSEQAASSGVDIKEYSIEYVVTSPFLRCLQTSAQVLKQLNLPLDALIVDSQICEICCPRTLNFGGGVYPSGHPEGWMWNGESLQAAVRECISSDPIYKNLAGQPEVLDTHMPYSRESIEDAMSRYSKAMQRLSDAYPSSNILLVTHGEAVRESVNRINPLSTIYEVKHAGFTVACRPKPTLAKFKAWTGRKYGQASAQWKLLTESGTTGVSWV